MLSLIDQNAGAEQVHEWHEAAINAGGEDNGKPGPRPEYHPGYYCAFVRDPVLGINFEVVYRHPSRTNVRIVMSDRTSYVSASYLSSMCSERAPFRVARLRSMLTLYPSFCRYGQMRAQVEAPHEDATSLALGYQFFPGSSRRVREDSLRSTATLCH